MPPIIHIGLHKTATNWFQSYIYPEADSHRFIDRRLVRQTILGASAFSFNAESARKELGIEAGDGAFAICEEDLSGTLHDGGIAASFAVAAVAHRLKAVAPEAQIVIVVRAQASLSASCYHQYIREGGTASPLRYLFPEEYRHLGNVRPLRVPRFDFSQFDHHLLVAHYDFVFGQENVHVFAYEELVRDPTRFLDQFSAKVGLKGARVPRMGRRLNSSYRRGLIPFARFANLFTERFVADKRILVHIPYWYTVRKALLEQLNRLPIFGKPARAADLFGPQAIRWINARFAPGNRRLAERMGVDLGALGYPVSTDAPSPEKPRRPRWLAWTKV